MSATTGTASAGIRTDLTTYLRGATALAAGLSIRATGRLLGVDKDTANHGLPVLGQHCQSVMNYFATCICSSVNWMSCGRSSTRRKTA